MHFFVIYTLQTVHEMHSSARIEYQLHYPLLWPSSDCVMSRAECLLTPSHHGSDDHNVNHDVHISVDHSHVDHEEDGVSLGRLERKRQSWRRHKFSSLDRAGWDQAKQTISKGNKMVEILQSFFILSIPYINKWYANSLPNMHSGILIMKPNIEILILSACLCCVAVFLSQLHMKGYAFL